MLEAVLGRRGRLGDDPRELVRDLVGGIAAVFALLPVAGLVLVGQLEVMAHGIGLIAAGLALLVVAGLAVAHGLEVVARLVNAAVAGGAHVPVPLAVGLPSRGHGADVVVGVLVGELVAAILADGLAHAGGLVAGARGRLGAGAARVRAGAHVLAVAGIVPASPRVAGVGRDGDGVLCLRGPVAGDSNDRHGTVGLRERVVAVGVGHKRRAVGRHGQGRALVGRHLELGRLHVVAGAGDDPVKRGGTRIELRDRLVVVVALADGAVLVLLPLLGDRGRLVDDDLIVVVRRVGVGLAAGRAGVPVVLVIAGPGVHLRAGVIARVLLAKLEAAILADSLGGAGGGLPGNVVAGLRLPAVGACAHVPGAIGRLRPGAPVVALVPLHRNAGGVLGRVSCGHGELALEAAERVLGEHVVSTRVRRQGHVADLHGDAALVADGEGLGALVGGAGGQAVDDRSGRVLDDRIPTVAVRPLHQVAVDHVGTVVVVAIAATADGKLVLGGRNALEIGGEPTAPNVHLAPAGPDGSRVAVGRGTLFLEEGAAVDVQHVALPADLNHS